MSRLLSCSHTTAQVRDRSKTVTRRKGWKFLRVGDRLTLVEKAMGLPKGSRPVRLAEVEVVSVFRAPLDVSMGIDVVIGPDEDPWPQWECEREGFPEMTPIEFVDFFATTFGGDIDQEITRIEWKYLDG